MRKQRVNKKKTEMVGVKGNVGPSMRIMLLLCIQTQEAKEGSQ